MEVLVGFPLSLVQYRYNFGAHVSVGGVYGTLVFYAHGLGATVDAHLKRPLSSGFNAGLRAMWVLPLLIIDHKVETGIDKLSVIAADLYGSWTSDGGGFSIGLVARLLTLVSYNPDAAFTPSVLIDMRIGLVAGWYLRIDLGATLVSLGAMEDCASDSGCGSSGHWIPLPVGSLGFVVEF